MSLCPQNACQFNYNKTWPFLSKQGNLYDFFEDDKLLKNDRVTSEYAGVSTVSWRQLRHLWQKHLRLFHQDLYLDRTVMLLNMESTKKRPFFLYLALPHPHFPVEAPEE